MASTIWLSVPAIIALLAKLLLLVYTKRSINRLTTLYLLFLFFLGLMNIGEIGHFAALSQNQVPFYTMHIYYLGGIMALPALLLLALEIGYPTVPILGRVVGWIVLGLSVVLSILLFASPWVITGYEKLGLSATRVPGPLYPLVEILVIGAIVSSIALFVRGVVKHESPRMQLMNAYMIVAFVPLALVGVVVIVALRFFQVSINAAILGPIAITVFLCVTAYATHHYKLFDISICLPSFIKRRTGGIENQLRRLMTHLPDTIPRVLKEIANVVNSPIAMVGRGNPVAIGGNVGLVDLSQSDLLGLSAFTSTGEIHDSALRRKLERNDISFIAPFSPEEDSKSWFVFGARAKEAIVTNDSFELTGRLCDRINAYYGMDLVSYKTALRDAQEKIKSPCKPAIDAGEVDTKVAVVCNDQQRVKRLASIFPHADFYRKRSDDIDSHIIYADLGAFTSHDIRVWRRYSGAVVWFGEGDVKRGLFDRSLVYDNKYFTWAGDDWLSDTDELRSFHVELRQISQALAATGYTDRVAYFNLSLDQQFIEALNKIDAAIGEWKRLVIGTTANRQEIIDIIKQRLKKNSMSLEVIRSAKELSKFETVLNGPRGSFPALATFDTIGDNARNLLQSKNVLVFEIRASADDVDVFLPGFKHRDADKIIYGRWIEGRLCMAMRKNPLPNAVLKILVGKANTADMIRDNILGYHNSQSGILPEGATNLTAAVDQYELAIIKKALQETNNNKSLAARNLGIRSNTLHYKLEHHGLARQK